MEFGHKFDSIEATRALRDDFYIRLRSKIFAQKVPGQVFIIS